MPKPLPRIGIVMVAAPHGRSAGVEGLAGEGAAETRKVLCVGRVRIGQLVFDSQSTILSDFNYSRHLLEYDVTSSR